MSIEEIRKWMRANVSEYVDECGEVNCTQMVEAWDHMCGSGEETLDETHEAWDIAVEVAAEYEL